MPGADHHRVEFAASRDPSANATTVTTTAPPPTAPDTPAKRSWRQKLTGGAPLYRYGDQMTGLEIIWTQNENNDASVGTEDIALHAVHFDPAEALADDPRYMESFRVITFDR